MLTRSRPDAGLAQAQAPTPYTDPATGIEFGTWTPGTGFTFGLALPNDALTTDADEYIGLLVGFRPPFGPDGPRLTRVPSDARRAGVASPTASRAR